MRTRIRQCLRVILLFAGLASIAHAESLYEIGNSLTWDSRPAATSVTADAWGRPLTVGHHIRTASSLSDILVGEPTFFGEFGPFNEALLDYSWDHVMLQIHKTNGNTLGHDIEAIGEFINLTRSNPANAETKFYVYGSWPWHAQFVNWDYVMADDLSTPSINAELYYHHVVERASDLIDERVNLVPVGEVLERLDDEAKAGRVPGITSVVNMYDDHTHMNVMGQYLASTTVLATILGEDPRGKPVPEEYWDHPLLTPARVAKFQQIVWDVVANNPYTGVVAPRLGDVNGDGDVDQLDLDVLQTDMANQPVLRADGNGDRRVDALDLQLWEQSLNPTPSEIAANFNGDLAINSADYNLWAASFGKTGNLVTDANDDGLVNLADYTIWRDAIGSYEARLSADYNDDGKIDLLDRNVWEEQNGLYWQLRADFSGNGILDNDDYVIWQENFHDFSARLVGDYDQNGVVNLDDRNVWMWTNGSRFNLNADGNGDGEVDMADYAVWRNFYALSLGSAAHSSVPEPNATVLAVLILATVIWKSRTARCG